METCISAITTAEVDLWSVTHSQGTVEICLLWLGRKSQYPSKRD